MERLNGRCGGPASRKVRRQARISVVGGTRAANAGNTARRASFGWVRLRSSAVSPLLALPSLLILLSACGYHFSGTRAAFPDDVRTLSVGAITNSSRQFGLEKSLAFALEREVHARGQLRLVEAPEVGDAVLSGAIRSFSIRPVAFDSRDEAVQYEADLRVDLTLRRQADGAVLWKASGLEAFEEYSVRAATVITSSSQFQRGTLNTEDLDAMTDIQLAETEKRLAIERLLESVARDAHDRMLEDF